MSEVRAKIKAMIKFSDLHHLAGLRHNNHGQATGVPALVVGLVNAQNI